jgi:hypothetical protein
MFRLIFGIGIRRQEDSLGVEKGQEPALGLLLVSKRGNKNYENTG